MNVLSVSLHEITTGNRAQVEALRVSAGQEASVYAVAQSLEEAAANLASHPWFRA